MAKTLLALLLSLTLVLPQGWAGVALYLCGAEQAIHLGDVGDCCKKQEPCPHHAEGDEVASDACCAELGSSDDRASATPDAPLPDLIDAGPPPEPTWPAPRVHVERRVGIWDLGPPPVGPPPWLRLRTLLL